MKYFNLKFLTFFLTALLAFGVGWAGEVTVTKTVNDLRTQYGWQISSGNNVNGLYTNFNLDDNISISTSGTPNCGSIWTTTNTSSILQWRIYQAQNGDITITAKNDCTLKSIKLTYATTNGGTLTGAANNTDVSVDGTEVTFTISNTENKTNGQVRITQFSVTYETPDTPQPSAPTLTAVPTSLPNINDLGGSFTVNGSNLGTDNVGVTTNNGFSTTTSDKYWGFENGSALVNGTITEGIVYVTYQGRDLIANGTVVLDNNDLDPALEVPVSYRSDIYIVNNHGDDSWNFGEGIKMTYNDGVYTGTFTAENANTKIAFARMLGDGVDWDTRLVFGAASNGDWVYGTYTSGDLNLNDDVAILFPQTGEYTITINPATNKFSISREDLPTPIGETCPAVIEFKDNYNQDGEPADATVKFANMTAFLAAVSAGSGYINNATWNDYVYQGATGIKFSNSSKNGELTINLKELTSGSWRANKIIVNAKSWINISGNADNGAGLSINGTSFSTTNDFDDYELTLDDATALESITIAATNRIYVKSITIMHECGDEPIIDQVAIPTFSPAAGTYTEVQNVEISCATEGATIYYTTDGSEPTTASAVYSTAIEVAQNMTIKAMAVKNGMDNSVVATAEYIINLPPEVETIAAAQALDNNTTFNFTGNAVVTFHNSNHLYIRDESGSGLIYGVNAGTKQYKNGDVLTAGWKAKYAIYQEYTPEFTDPSNVGSTVNNVAVEPLPLTTIELGDVNKYAKIDNVTITSIDGENYYFTVDGNNYCLRRAYTNLVNALEEGKTYNVTGVVTIYRSGSEGNYTYTPQLNLITAELIKEDVTLTFDPASVELYVGQAFTAPELKGLPEGATVTYSSSNAEVATVTDNVVSLVAGATGTATITATFAGNDYYNEATATYTITVKAKEDAGLSYGENTTVTATYGDTEFTEPELTNPNNLTVTYSSSDTDVATVDAEGNVTIVGAGTATITATTTGDESHAGGTASYTINVAKANATVTFSEHEYTVYVGADFTEPTLTTDPEGLEVTYSIEGNENETVLFDEEDGTVVIGDVPGTVTITATFAGNDNYNEARDSYTITVEAKPYVMADPTSLDFEAVIGQDAVTKTFTVMAENLKGDITLTLSETDVFTINPATIAKADAEEGVEVTVTYTPTAATGEDFDKATVTITSTDAETVTVSLTGMATLPDPELTVSTETLEMGTDPTGTFTVTGQHLTENVTLTVTEGTAANFEISPATIAPDEDGKVNQEVTVTYKGTSTEDEYATITVASGTAKEEVIVTARVLPTPEIIADPESLTMAAVVGQTPATATFTVMASDLRGDITLTLSETEVFTIEPATIAKADMTEEGVEVTVTYTPTQAGNDNATITIASEAAESVTITLNGTATVPEVVATPTFSLVAGSYTGAQTVTIGCATEGATISYSTDGGNTWTEGNTVNVDKDMTIMAKASKDGYTTSVTATATYIIDIPEELPTITPFKGYYQIKNNGNNKYANIAGRKTLNFTDAPADKAGTVIWLETNDKGQVQSIRSQAADLQGYANRAMHYVPEMVQMVVEKLDAEGASEILGENGLGEIMQKFNECFDYHLYVEQAQGGYRLYGKTPNMQHVVDFYREHTAQVEAKLPQLEQFINDALDKLISKIGGSSVFTDFSLHQIWEKMGGTLTEPVDDASIMAFYREVLNNKNYVWDFAYQTAQIYWGNVKNHPLYQELKAQQSEYADYIDEFVTQLRPDFKYYVIQRGDEPDYISEGNTEIINNDPRTLWTLEPRTDFTVNIAGEQFGCPYAGGVGGYATTNYTDFAYTLPEGVTAYKVTSTEGGVATLQALSGVIPAQTPVLLMAKEAGGYVLTLSTEAGTAVSDNLLVGTDYLIEKYQLNTQMVEQLFGLAKAVLGEQLYNQYIAQYEYLQLLYAGTVNNKYFWGLSQDNVEKCVYDLDGSQDCVIRNLGDGAFVNDWKSPMTNKAFLVSETDQTISINDLKGDVNHDGLVNINDVTTLIDFLLEIEGRGCPYCSDVNNDNAVNIKDVTDLIDILLGV